MKKIIILFVLVFTTLPVFADVDIFDLKNDKKIQANISETGFKILNANRIDKRMSFHYKKKNIVNAYSLPSNRDIVIFSGLLKYLETDAELAAILSHEISHSIDSYDGICRGYFSIWHYAFTPKKFEIKADKRAVDFMVNAGYNPITLIVVYNKIMSQYRYDWYATHPLTSRRMMHIYEYIYNKYPQYLINNEFKNNIYYQNFLLNSKDNRLKLKEKIDAKSTKKVNYL